MWHWDTAPLVATCCPPDLLAAAHLCKLRARGSTEWFMFIIYTMLTVSHGSAGESQGYHMVLRNWLPCWQQALGAWFRTLWQSDSPNSNSRADHQETWGSFCPTLGSGWGYKMAPCRGPPVSHWDHIRSSRAGTGWTGPSLRSNQRGYKQCSGAVLAFILQPEWTGKWKSGTLWTPWVGVHRG